MNLKIVKKELFVVLIDKSLEHTYSNSCILLAFYPNKLKSIGMVKSFWGARGRIGLRGAQ